MEKKNKKAYFYTGRILLFFLFFLLAARPTQAATITADGQVDCPSVTPTEILVYFHGLVWPTSTQNGDQWTVQESISTFYTELNKIRASRPGVAAAHYSYGANAQAAINNVRSQCNISGVLPITLAGHSAGGSSLKSAGAIADKIIILDGIYWSPTPLYSYCSKIRLVDGYSTQSNTTPLVTECSGNASFKYVKYQDIGNPGHFAIRKYLSTFYLDSEITAGGTAGATTKPKKPFELFNPLLDLQVNIPGIEKLASETPAACTTSDDNITSCSLPWISVYIKAIYNYSMSIVGILAAFVIMIGGVIYLTSTGNANRIKSAQSWITGGLTGLLIMFTSYVLLNEINPDLIKSNPIDLQIVRDEFVQDPNDINLGDLPVGSGAGSGEVLNDGVPFFNQCNASWRDFPYDGKSPYQCGGGDPGYSVDGAKVKGNTLCSSSCGVNSAAMVLKYYGYEVTPPLLANWLVDNKYRGTNGTCSGTSFQGIQDVIKNYGPDIKSEYVKANNYVAALQAGKKIIYLMRGPCPLKKSQGGHYVVLTGVKTGSGNSIININDPFRGQRKQASTSDINTCWAGGMAFYQ